MRHCNSPAALRAPHHPPTRRQFFGVGVFTPLDWICADASVFDVFFDIFAVAFLPAACGLGFSYILQARARRLCVLARVCV